MPGSRTNVARDGPQSQRGRERKPDSRVSDARRKSGTLSPGVALQALRLGGRLSAEQAASLSHTVGNRALEELLSASGGPELLQRPLPSGDVRTPPLSVPDNAPEAPLASASPVWGGAGETLSPAWSGATESASPAWGESGGGG